MEDYINVINEMLKQEVKKKYLFMLFWLLITLCIQWSLRIKDTLGPI